MDLRKTIATGLVVLMPFTLAGCSDEDDDGAVTDEEIGELGEEIEEGVNELEDGG